MIKNRHLDSQLLEYINQRVEYDGHDIIPLREMAEEFDVALSTVWLAIRRLEKDGKIERHANHPNCYHLM